MGKQNRQVLAGAVFLGLSIFGADHVLNETKQPQCSTTEQQEERIEDRIGANLTFPLSYKGRENDLYDDCEERQVYLKHFNDDVKTFYENADELPVAATNVDDIHLYQITEGTRRWLPQTSDSNDVKARVTSSWHSSISDEYSIDVYGAPTPSLLAHEYAHVHHYTVEPLRRTASLHVPYQGSDWPEADSTLKDSLGVPTSYATKNREENIAETAELVFKLNAYKYFREARGVSLRDGSQNWGERLANNVATLRRYGFISASEATTAYEAISESAQQLSMSNLQSRHIP